MRVYVLIVLLIVGGCVRIPEGVEPIKNFDINKYLGKWYEIARLDHSFERGLSKVTAEYSLRDDEGVKVLNSGYSLEKGKWKTAEGKAYFVNTPDQGYLKVTFFWPFYGSYIIFNLDEDYQYSMVCGPDKSYLWLLSRKPVIDQDIIDGFIKKSKELGFNIDEIIFVEQE